MKVSEAFAAVATMPLPASRPAVAMTIAAMPANLRVDLMSLLLPPLSTFLRNKYGRGAEGDWRDTEQMEKVLSAVIARLPLTPGVYRFRDAADQVLYLGRATVLRRRVASYWLDLRDRGHLAPMVARVRRIEAVSCDSAHEAAWLERNLLATSLPPWNLTMGGQEHPVYIRLDPRPARPGLSVAHEPANRPAGTAYFGPYLGGRPARAAGKGLGRVLQ